MSESDCSDVVENTPEKEDNNRTILGKSFLRTNKQTFNKEFLNFRKYPIQVIESHSDDDDDDDDIIVNRGRPKMCQILSSDSDESDKGPETSVSKSKASAMGLYREAKARDSSSNDESDINKVASEKINDSGDLHKSKPVETGKYRDRYTIESSDSEDSNERAEVFSISDASSIEDIASGNVNNNYSDTTAFSSNNYVQKDKSKDESKSKTLSPKSKTETNESKSKTLTHESKTEKNESKSETLSPVTPESNAQIRKVNESKSKTLSPKSKTEGKESKSKTLLTDKSEVFVESRNKTPRKINESKSKTLSPKSKTEGKESKSKTLSTDKSEVFVESRNKTPTPKSRTSGLSTGTKSPAQKEISAKVGSSHEITEKRRQEESSVIIIDDTIDSETGGARESIIQIPSSRFSNALDHISEKSFLPTNVSTPFRIADPKDSKESDHVSELEQSFGAIAISENKKSTDSSSEQQKLSAKKKQMVSDITNLTREIEKLKMILRTVNLSSLADRGTRLQMSVNDKQSELKRLKEEWKSLDLDSLPVENTWKPEVQKVVQNEKPPPNLPPGSSGAVPKKTGFLGSMPSMKGMGKRALETYMGEKAMTVEALKHLHESLKSCPGENVIAEDPKSLRSSVELMAHQKRALAWLVWRESHKPYGGILADDMGLGKTLTMISLVLKSREELKNKGVDEGDEDSDEEENNSWQNRKYEKGGTLVACPASLINQWEGEVKKRVKKGILDVEVYHGQTRETKPRRLARHDMVITTYNIVRSEGAVRALKSGSTVDSARQGALFGVKWERIILDEAHTIRNEKSQTAIAACYLRAKHRWALTGTPVHNKELDLYSLLKFLRCSPFDDLVVWRRWIGNKSAGGIQRLNTVINSLMLRRTKVQLQSAGSLSCLPSKDIYEICVKFDKEEFEVYQTVLTYSRSLFAQFLGQKVEKEQIFEAKYGESNNPTYMQNGKNTFPYDMNEELKALHQKMRNMNTKGDIKSFHILVLLLRLRQICCHAGLIENMLDNEICKNDGIEDGGLDVDLLSQLNKLGLEDNEESESVDADKEVKKRVLVPSNPVFQKDRISSKMRAVFKELQEKVVCNGDNAVVVSQFTSLLELVRKHLRAYGIKCLILTGAVPVKERMALVEDFNSSSERTKVMLLSLTAGGVGLNLIGGNHLLLLDPHWNPQLEAQAFDRIYRVGQKKPVHIYKFYTDETIEQQIRKLQIIKLELAKSVLAGGKHHQVNKLSMDDLKMLFNFNKPER